MGVMSELRSARGAGEILCLGCGARIKGDEPTLGGLCLRCYPGSLPAQARLQAQAWRDCYLDRTDNS